MLRSRPCLAEPPARVALDQEQFALGRVAFLAVGELAGQRGDVHHALAPGQLARALGGFARRGGVDDLGNDLARIGRIFLEPLGHLVAHQAFERLAHFAADELVLGLRTELGIGQLDRDDRGQPFAHVVAGQADLFLFQHARFLGIAVDRAGQRGAERGHVGAAVALRDVVGERQDVLIIAVVPLERDVDADAVADRRNGDRLGQQRGLGAVEIFDEGGDPALVIKLMLDALLVARIGQDQAHARVEEGELAIAMLELLEVEFDDLEGLGARQEGDLGALLALGRGADDLQRRDRVADRRSACNAPRRRARSSGRAIR